MTGRFLSRTPRGAYGRFGSGASLRRDSANALRGWERAQPRPSVTRNVFRALDHYVRGDDIDPWVEPLAVMAGLGGAGAALTLAGQHRHDAPFRSDPGIRQRRQELRDLRRLIRELREQRRLQQSMQQGYNDGLRIEHERLMRQMRDIDDNYAWDDREGLR